jgi:hypothetical protein
MGNAHKYLVRKSLRMRLLGEPRHRWDYIKVGLKKINRIGGSGIGFIWLRTESSGGFCEYGNKPSFSIKSQKFLD